MIGPYCKVNENGGLESLSLEEGGSVYGFDWANSLDRIGAHF
jgi:hypothetical protein